MTRQPFARVAAAIATPFRVADLHIDHDLLRAHARWLLASGCDGLVLFGTTGEAASLTLAERREILERLVAGGVAPERLVVGVGCCSVGDTAELASHAARQGCAGALVVPPFFYKALSEEGVKAWYGAVIARCGEDLPPIYLYHIPQVSAVPLGPDLTGALIAEHGERIRGYKDSGGDFANTREILARFPHLEVFVGSEAQLLAVLGAGGAGCISATTNVQPQAARRLVAGWRGDEADRLQARLSAVRSTLERYGPLVSSAKAALAEIHSAPAWRTPRPPLTAVAEDRRARLIEELRALELESLPMTAGLRGDP